MGNHSCGTGDLLESAVACSTTLGLNKIRQELTSSGRKRYVFPLDLAASIDDAKVKAVVATASANLKFYVAFNLGFLISLSILLCICWTSRHKLMHCLLGTFFLPTSSSSSLSKVWFNRNHLKKVQSYCLCNLFSNNILSPFGFG